MSADAADAGAPNLASLFSTLEDALRSFSLHKALHACDQILAIAPADEDALRAKVAVCIHSESFDAALALLSAHPDLAARLPFEKAYCLYRASRHKEALELLRDAEADIPAEHAAGALQLRAQLQYRAGAFEDCIRTYETALEAGQLTSPEARANVIAAYISADRARDVPALLASLGLSVDECFEASYNVGCAKLAEGNLAEAHELLLLSHRMGREALLDEEYAEEDIEKELLPILVQLAHVTSLQGRTKEAAETYARLLKLKPSDVVSAAVAASNLVAARGAHELFDGLKRLDKMLERGGAGTSTQFVGPLELRLSDEQKQVICFNRATLLLHSSKLEQCRELLAVLSSRFPDNDAASLLNAALQLREKRAAKADEVLAAFLSARRGAPERALLMRAQLAAAAGDGARTLAALAELAEPLRFSPRIVATCVALHASQGEHASGEKLLDAALAYWDSQARGAAPGAAPSRAACLARAAAAFKHSCGQHAASVALYERLLQDATTEEARAGALEGLVLACSHTDIAAAERYAERVAPGGVGGDLDAEELELSSALGRLDPSEPAEDASRKRDAPLSGATEQPRKRRVRKTRYPKGFDPAAPGNPPPDPERWLPRRERSTYKGKKSKKAQLRGAQGAAPAAAAAAAAIPTAVAAAVPEGKKKKGRK